ncbi:MAG TPA: hypothetical protein VMU39_09520 [Solirubrobacteraceae bacterium]|nr:hypothetical protein [Solirubrobacteraceae bacterium]
MDSRPESRDAAVVASTLAGVMEANVMLDAGALDAAAAQAP